MSVKSLTMASGCVTHAERERIRNTAEVLTVGQLKPGLFLLLTRCGSGFGFDVGQLLWFHFFWKKRAQNELMLEFSGNGRI